MAKLILFDIDGTLTIRNNIHTQAGWPRFLYAIEKAYGVKAEIDLTVNYNGLVDRQIMWNIVEKYGISKISFDKNFHIAAKALFTYTIRQDIKGEKYYLALDDAVKFAKILKKSRQYHIGLLTGNIQKMAYWKLKHTGISAGLFSFGLFGDTADDRMQLAASVFSVARKALNTIFKPEDIVIIGDAVGDIMCANHIGAFSIIVTTGRHTDKEVLRSHKPGMLVDSLMDENVLRLFSLL